MAGTDWRTSTTSQQFLKNPSSLSQQPLIWLQAFCSVSKEARPRGTMAEQVVSQTRSPGSYDSQEEPRPLSSASDGCEARLYHHFRLLDRVIKHPSKLLNAVFLYVRNSHPARMSQNYHNFLHYFNHWVSIKSKSDNERGSWIKEFKSTKIVTINF